MVGFPRFSEPLSGSAIFIEEAYKAEGKKLVIGLLETKGLAVQSPVGRGISITGLAWKLVSI